MDFYKGNIPIIDDSPEGRSYAMPRHIDGVRVGYGYVPRDYKLYPEEMFAAPDAMQIIPESEYDARYDEQERTKSSLEHMFLSGPNGEPRFINLDQNGQGFCWAYSTGQAIMLDRLKQGLPIVRLSPHAVACKIKGFRDEGGWGGLSAKFAREVGYPDESVWPQQSMSRQYDNEATWKNAALHKLTDEWVDLTRSVYDQNLTMQQSNTCSFNNIPGPEDFNWWGHSVCRLRWVRIEAGSWGKLILNSWKGWGRFGLGVLRGSQARCDGALGFRMTTAA
jgi:hypothetical protein